MAVSEREVRANALGNARDGASRDDVHWLVSEALGAWNRIAALEADIASLAQNERDAAVAEAAAAFIESIGSFAHYRSGKWQASGDADALRLLYEAVERRDVAGRAASAATREGGR